MRDRQTALPRLAQHRQPAHGDLLRTVHGDLQRAVLQRAVREALQERLDITLDGEARRCRGEGCNVLQHQSLDEAGERRIGHDVGDERLAKQGADIGDGGVGAVEEPQLQLLVGSDITDQLRPSRFPVRPAGGEVILDHPLRKCLGTHRRLVAQAQQGGRMVERGRRRGRDDPVDHAAREADLILNPDREIAVELLGELPDEAVQRATVARHVVAAEHGEPAGTSGPPLHEPAHEPAEGRAWWVPARKVGLDIGMGEIEITRRRVMTVALLGDGERHEPRRLSRKPGEQDRPLLRRPQRLAKDPDDARLLVDPVILEQGVEAILRPERVAHSSAAQAGTADRPGTRDDSERALGDDRLMRAMKGTEAQVDNADVGVERRRGGELRRQRPRQGALRKAIHPMCLDFLIGYRWRSSMLVY